MIEIFVLFLVGIGVGTFGTLVGIGGGLIMIPLFTFALTPSIFQTAPQIIGTSLFGVFLNAISGTFAYVKQKRVYFKAAIPFAIATLPGAFLGSLVSDYFTGPSFSLAYGIFILFIAIIMYWNSSNKKVIANEFDEKLFQSRKKTRYYFKWFCWFHFQYLRHWRWSYSRSNNDLCSVFSTTYGYSYFTFCTCCIFLFWCNFSYYA